MDFKIIRHEDTYFYKVTRLLYLFIIIGLFADIFIFDLKWFGYISIGFFVFWVIMIVISFKRKYIEIGLFKVSPTDLIINNKLKTLNDSKIVFNLKGFNGHSSGVKVNFFSVQDGSGNFIKIDAEKYEFLIESKNDLLKLIDRLKIWNSNNIGFKIMDDFNIELRIDDSHLINKILYPSHGLVESFFIKIYRFLKQLLFTKR